MGLGKTLTMLAAIIRTVDEAKAFADLVFDTGQSSTGVKPIHSRGTLAVVPTPCETFEEGTKKLQLTQERSVDSRVDTGNQIVSLNCRFRCINGDTDFSKALYRFRKHCNLSWAGA